MNFNILSLKIAVFLILVQIDILKAQDPVFSQYYSSPLQINPAFTGLLDGVRLGANYRNQWPFIDQSFKSYVTYNLFYDQFFTSIKSGFGMEITSDQAGDGFMRNTKISGFYGYKIPINRKGHVIKGGLELAYVNMSIGWDKFIFRDQIDPVNGYQTGGGTIISKDIRPQDIKPNYIDIGMGILYYSPLYYVGASIKHMNSPDIGILVNASSGGTSLPPRINIHSGFEIPLYNDSRKKRHILSPSMAIITQSSFFQLNVGTQYLFNNIYTGLFYRHARLNPDAAILILGFKKDNYKIGYSFDFTVSSLTISQGGSHELSFLYQIPGKAGKSSNVSDCFEAFR
ncbi:MAG: PorP/SprF family type IX secretion system membrane protein [Saprospiraceae bacterium]|nr:PorP/SprF family type IX secretion system membrane protein [Saprospiraceae bacterium]